jgi:hypothetical protein
MSMRIQPICKVAHTYIHASSSDGTTRMLRDVVTPLYADWILAACAWVSAGACAAACSAHDRRLHLITCMPSGRT